jgi:hypothetical protein
MGKLRIFKNIAVSKLATSIGDHLGEYASDEPWADEFLGNPSQTSLETSIELPEKLALVPPDGDGHHDLENSIQVHRAIIGLNPVQARDPRLWTKLVHVDFWGYVRKRWPAERHSDPEKARRFIESRYFVLQNQSRCLVRNAISRLWWSARMSYDEGRSNPYELTGVLFQSLDINQQILERGMGRSRSVLLPFLDYILSNKDTLLNAGDASRARVRALAKHMNSYGGVCVLDCLPASGIKRLMDECLKRLQKKE